MTKTKTYQFLRWEYYIDDVIMLIFFFIRCVPLKKVRIQTREDNDFDILCYV